MKKFIFPLSIMIVLNTINTLYATETSKGKFGIGGNIGLEVYGEMKDLETSPGLVPFPPIDIDLLGEVSARYEVVSKWLLESGLRYIVRKIDGGSNITGRKGKTDWEVTAVPISFTVLRTYKCKITGRRYIGGGIDYCFAKVRYTITPFEPPQTILKGAGKGNRLGWHLTWGFERFLSSKKNSMGISVTYRSDNPTEIKEGGNIISVEGEPLQVELSGLYFNLNFIHYF